MAADNTPKMKVCVLGHVNTGKSSLVHLAMNDLFLEQGMPPRALVIKRFRLQTSCGTVCLDLCEPSGLDGLSERSKRHCMTANAFLLCFDPGNPESWSTLERWMAYLLHERQGPDLVAIAIVACKTDLLDEAYFASGKELGNASRNEVSGKSTEGVDGDVFKEISKEFSNENSNENNNEVNPDLSNQAANNANHEVNHDLADMENQANHPQDKNVVSRARARRFAQEHEAAFFESSALSGRGCHAPFAWLAEELASALPERRCKEAEVVEDVERRGREQKKGCVIS